MPVAEASHILAATIPSPHWDYNAQLPRLPTSRPWRLRLANRALEPFPSNHKYADDNDYGFARSSGAAQKRQMSTSYTVSSPRVMHRCPSLIGETVLTTEGDMICLPSLVGIGYEQDMGNSSSGSARRAELCRAIRPGNFPGFWLA